MKSQRQRILESNPLTYIVAGREYRGMNPVYAPIKNEIGQTVGYRKIKPGIPFVRV